MITFRYPCHQGDLPACGSSPTAAHARFSDMEWNRSCGTQIANYGREWILTAGTV
jgi:hypothetical protein